jgi:hypothetical protein
MKYLESYKNFPKKFANKWNSDTPVEIILPNYLDEKEEAEKAKKEWEETNKEEENIDEGFFDFFKRKPKNTQQVYLDDIKECGYDLLHDNRIDIYVDGRPAGGISPNIDDILGKKRGMDLTQDYEDQFGETPNNIRGNVMVIQFRYVLYRHLKHTDWGNQAEILPQECVSRNEITEMLMDFTEKLKSLDCVASFFLAWGYDEGSTDDKEYKSIEKMMDVIYKTTRTPLVTMKITAPSEIIID